MMLQIQPNVSHPSDGRRIAGKPAACPRSCSRETWLPCGYRAELAQVMLCTELGVEDCDFTNGVAYLAHWLKKLRDDKREIFRAASDAQRIADYLLAFHPDYTLGDERGSADPSPNPQDTSAQLAAAA
jgi:hypothetical protein